MILSKEKIESLSEAGLRVAVLIPLFRAVGFQDVREHHGASEKGKDIVMWNRSPFGSRLDYAVVVKATPITGKATGKDSASEVQFQIMQCFGSTYLDAITLEERTISRVIVATSKDIRPPAQEAICAGLNPTSLRSHVDFIDGAKLWELVQQYLPSGVALTQLLQLTQQLDSDPQHKLELQAGGGKVSLQFTPRAGKVSKPKFAFGDDSESKKAQAAYEKMIKTGAAAEIPVECVVDVEGPTLLKELIAAGNIKAVTISSIPSSCFYPIRFDLRQDNAVVTSLVRNMKVAEHGTEEILITTCEPLQPINISVRAKKNGESSTVEVEPQFRRTNAKEELDGLRFYNALREGAELTITQEHTGIVMASGPIKLDLPPVDDNWVKLVEMLAFIQKRTSTVLMMPEDRTIRPDDARVIFMVAAIVKHGGYSIPFVQEELVLDHQQAIQFIENAANEPLRQEHEWTKATIFGTEIELGPSFAVWPDFFIPENHLERIRKEIAEKKPSVSIVIAAPTPTTIPVVYPKWAGV